MQLKTFLKIPGCVPGTYEIIGRRGVRRGESKCLQKRLPRVLKKHADCTGPATKIKITVEPRKRERRNIEKQGILLDWIRGIRSCNRVAR